MARTMGFDFGLADTGVCFKHKFRWLLKIPGISAEGIDALPPFKGARPSVSFKEMDVQHLTETVYYPSKVEYKPLPLTLYDLKRNKHPVWEWVKKVYNAQTGNWSPSVSSQFIKPQARLEIYDGCGNTLETWIIENVYPQDPKHIDWQLSFCTLPKHLPGSWFSTPRPCTPRICSAAPS